MEKKKFIDYYAILGISYEATDEEIKQARKNLAKKYHPDANPGLDEAAKKELEEKLKDVNSACEVLLNKEERESYDIKYHLYKSQQAAREQQHYKRQQYQQAAKNYQAYQNKQTTSSYKSGEKTTTNANTTTDDGYYESEASHFNTNRNNEKQKEQPKKNTAKKIIDDYKAVREDEKKEPFMKRHKILDRNYCKNLIPEKPSVVKNILFQFGRGTIHVSAEFIYQILKLRYIAEDSIPKYILRNRVLATAVVATIIATNVAGAQTDNSSSEDIVTPISSTEIYGNDTYIPAGIERETSLISTETPTEAQEEDLHVLNRIYTVESGDTLAKLSDSSNTTINCIEQANNINNDSLFVGQVLIIPYYVEESEMSYYTSVQCCSPSMNIEDLAAANETDVATLVKLNGEAIVNVNNQYAVLTDTIIVPTFITRDELETQKATTQTEVTTQKTYS